MIVRPVRAEEADAVLAMYHELIDEMRGSPFRPTWKKGVYPTREELRAAARAGSLFAAEESSGFIGAFVRDRSQAEGYRDVSWGVDAPEDRVSVLHLLAVSPRVQGRGVGRVLLRKALEVSREAGDLAVRLDSLPWNEPARRLYESEGFQLRGEKRLFYPGAGDISFRVYEYILDPHDPRGGAAGRC